MRKYLELVRSQPSCFSSKFSISSLLGVGDVVIEWCKSHPSDVSGWTFLNHLCLFPVIDEEHRYRYISDVTDFVRKYRWKGEAIWTFIRLSIANPGTLNLDHNREISASLKQELQILAGSLKATHLEAYVLQLRKAVEAAQCNTTSPL